MTSVRIYALVFSSYQPCNDLRRESAFHTSGEILLNLGPYFIITLTMLLLNDSHIKELYYYSVTRKNIIAMKLF